MAGSPEIWTTFPVVCNRPCARAPLRVNGGSGADLPLRGGGKLAAGVSVEAVLSVPLQSEIGTPLYVCTRNKKMVPEQKDLPTQGAEAPRRKVRNLV